jgi:hypothetical protein
VALGLDSDHHIYALVPGDFHLDLVERELSGSRTDTPFISRMTQLRRELSMPVQFRMYGEVKRDPQYALQVLEEKDPTERLKDGALLPRRTVERIRQGLHALQLEDPGLFYELVTRAKFSKPGVPRPFADPDVQMRIALYGFLEPSGRVKDAVVHVVRSAVRGSVIGSPYQEDKVQGASLGKDAYRDLMLWRAVPSKDPVSVTVIDAVLLKEMMVAEGLLDRLSEHPHEVVRAMWHGDALSEAEASRVRARVLERLPTAAERFQIVDMRSAINPMKGMQAMLEGRPLADLLRLARTLDPRVRTEQDLWPHLAVLADPAVIEGLTKQHVKVAELPAAALPQDPALREAAHLKMAVLTGQLAALAGDLEAFERVLPGLLERTGESFRFTEALLEKLAELTRSYLASRRVAQAA